MGKFLLYVKILGERGQEAEPRESLGKRREKGSEEQEFH